MKIRIATLVIVLSTGICTLALGQQVLNYEAGVRTAALRNEVSLLLKRSKKDLFFMRYQGTLNAGYNVFLGSSATWSSQAGFSIGVEWRKQWSDRIQFMHGPMPSLSMAYIESPSFKSWALQPALGYIIGLQYQLNEGLHLGVEVIPRAEGVINDEWELENINVGLSTASTGIFLVYQFSRSKD